MTKSETLGKLLEIVLTLRRINSEGNRSQVPVEGQEDEFDMYTEMAQNIREMMRDRRFGP